MPRANRNKATWAGATSNTGLASPIAGASVATAGRSHKARSRTRGAVGARRNVTTGFIQPQTFGNVPQGISKGLAFGLNSLTNLGVDWSALGYTPQQVYGHLMTCILNT